MLVVGGGHAPSEGLAMDYLRLWTMGLDEDKYLIIFIKNQCYYGSGWLLEAIYCDDCGNGYKCRGNFMKQYRNCVRAQT